MGSATKHRKKFLLAHPVCAFCGGESPSSTIEHCPPRAMFQYKQWPEGFEFPACVTCNNGTTDADLLVAMLARMNPFDEAAGDLDGRTVGLMHAVNQQYPELFEKMMPSASEARRHNRSIGVVPPEGQSHQDVSPVNIPSEMHVAVSAFAKKLAKGVFYQESGRPFPNEGCLLLNWFSNADIVKSGHYPVFEILKDIGGKIPPLKRSRKMLNDQFEYKVSISNDFGAFILQARFGGAFGLVVFGSTVRGQLENMVSKIESQRGGNGPFAVLQSPGG